MKLPLPKRSSATLFDAIIIISKIYTLIFSLIYLVAYSLPRRYIEILLEYVGIINSPAYDKKGKRDFKHILITGASVGIGLGQALIFAKPNVRLILLAHSKGSLKESIEKCKAKGATVIESYIDIKDKEKMEKFIKEQDEYLPIDLVIANAGVAPVWDGLKESSFVFETNIMGTMNTINLLAQRMKSRKYGQICLIASLGGIAPPNQLLMSPYNASKIGLIRYSNGLRIGLAKHNVGVTYVAPGFVESRMTDDQLKRGVSMYSRVTSENAAKYIHNGIIRNLPSVIFPPLTYLLSASAVELPDYMRDDFAYFYGLFDPYSVYENKLIQEKKI